MALRRIQSVKFTHKFYEKIIAICKRTVAVIDNTSLHNLSVNKRDLCITPLFVIPGLISLPRT
jgi:hypothetical protein